MLEIAFILAIYSIISCFQFAAGILAWQIGKSFTKWFWISLFLPIIAMVILVLLWDEKEVNKQKRSWG